MTEQVLYTEWDPDFEGFQPFEEGDDCPFSVEGFAPEKECEENPEALELITYAVVIRANRPWLSDHQAPKGPPKVFVGQRTTDAGEERLHGRMSFGWGGNINKGDMGVFHSMRTPSLRDVLYEATSRETQEELLLPPEAFFQFRGLLYDPSDGVGQDHLGMVVSLFTDAVAVRETDKYGQGQWADIVGGFWPWNPKNKEAQPLESWSELLVPHLQELARGDDR